MLPELWQISYTDEDLQEEQMYQGNFNQCLEMYYSIRKSGEQYNDVLNLKFERIK
jgi:hypothetical protein